MDLYYIKAKISVRVEGISGPFNETLSALVRGISTENAKTKFEAYVKQHYAHMMARSIVFDYVEIAGEIK